MLGSRLDGCSLALVIAALGGCSMAAQTRGEARLRADLDAHRFEQPLSQVWPAAIRVVSEHGFDLVGNDRLVVGAPPAGRLKRLTAGGFQTGRTAHGLALETMANASGTRYRVEGEDIEGRACRVTFIAIRRTGDAPSQERSRDLDMELDLVRRLDPEAAARIERAMEAARSGSP